MRVACFDTGEHPHHTIVTLIRSITKIKEVRKMKIIWMKKEKQQPDVLNISSVQLCELLKKAIPIVIEDVEMNCVLRWNVKSC